jgi:glucokinase
MPIRHAVLREFLVSTIGIDVGGTNIVSGVVDGSGKILIRHRIRTPSDSAQVVPVLCELVARLRKDHVVREIGLAAAGFVDADASTVLFAKHIGWVGEPLKARMEQETALPVVVENDANAAIWGETRFGAGQGERFLVGVTVGTGIGGGLVSGGQLMRGAAGLAAELGHLCVVPDGHPCGCGSRGCWEMYASGSALQLRAQLLAAVNSPLTARLLASAGGEPTAITGPLITRAAAAGDPGAVELLQELGGWLGRGLASLAAVLDPGCFVLGGGVADAGDLLLAPARAAFARHLSGRSQRPTIHIVTALLGTDAGVIGVADLARRHQDSSHREAEPEQIGR